MKQYERYKDSGVEWLGRVPENWGIIKSKYIWKESIELSLNGIGDLLSVSQYKGITVNTQEQRSENLIGYKSVSENSLVINIMLAWLGGLGISKLTGLVSPAYSVYKAICPIVPQFYHYLYRTDRYLCEFARKSTGVVPSRWRMYEEDFGQIISIFPPIEEQKAIANYLDQKCAQIDKAISQKEKVIELLNERRQIIIQRAVTRGLNPNVPMKDSGIDWIGKIPEHWEVKKLKYLTSKIGSGVTPTGGSSVYLENGIPLLRSQNIHFDRIDLSDVACISKFIDSTMSNTRVKEGDVLLNITGGSIGRCYYVKNDLGPANVNQHVCILRPYKFQSQFLYFLIRSNIGQIQIELEQTGGNREGLTFAALKNFIFPTTSLKEQNEVAAYLDQVNAKIDKAISIKRQEIERLKEYKTVLIDAAVTGKIKIA